MIEKGSSATVLCVFLAVCCSAGGASADFAQAQEPYLLEQSSLSLPDAKTSSKNIRAMKIADDYCNSRCIQRFNYCRYSGGSEDRCLYQLVHCRANC